MLSVASLVHQGGYKAWIQGANLIAPCNPWCFSLCPNSYIPYISPHLTNKTCLTSAPTHHHPGPRVVPPAVPAGFLIQTGLGCGCHGGCCFLFTIPAWASHFHSSAHFLLAGNAPLLFGESPRAHDRLGCLHLYCSIMYVSCGLLLRLDRHPEGP